MKLDKFNLRAHYLREMNIEKWVRFHSLPNSQRYPSNKNDYEIILFRNNAILNELFQTGTKLNLVLTSFSNDQSFLNDLVDKFQFKQWQVIHYEEDDYCVECDYYFWKSEFSWNTGILNEVIKKVANDDLTNTLLFDLNCSIIYHPYDGGMDFFFDDIQYKNLIKIKFIDWYPNNTNGY